MITEAIPVRQTDAGAGSANVTVNVKEDGGAAKPQVYNISLAGDPNVTLRNKILAENKAKVDQGTQTAKITFGTPIVLTPDAPPAKAALEQRTEEYLAARAKYDPLMSEVNLKLRQDTDKIVTDARTAAITALGLLDSEKAKGQ